VGSVGGGGSVLTAVLMHFVELEHELELLGSRYNTNLTEGKLEAFWWVPPSVAHNPPGGAGVGGVLAIV
jgi:hypothetical protein